LPVGGKSRRPHPVGDFNFNFNVSDFNLGLNNILFDSNMIFQELFSAMTLACPTPLVA
jgi:hypothetical protein